MAKMSAVILAAGMGTRMKSDQPKVLHQIGHQPMVKYVLSAIKQAGMEEICIVVGHGADAVQAALGDGYLYALQQPQLGTGHALAKALPAFATPPESLMVLCGDTPLLSAATLRELRQFFEESHASCTVMSTLLPQGGAYGRIIRDSAGELSAIVEARDATPEQLAITEINSGVYCFDGAMLAKVVNKLKPQNAQGEYYLTDLIAAIKAAGGKINAYICADAAEISGVNDRCELATVAKALRQRRNCELMLSGVTMIDPDTVYIDEEAEIAADCLIEPQVYIEGKCRIGAGSHIGPNVKMVDTVMGRNCEIGPFCYLRPGTVLADKVKAGHFVEIKKSHIGYGSKVPHLTYIGDAEIGEKVNIGCGTITCNYDGKNKHLTVIEDEVFIGSNTNLVAPVKVGRRSTVAAGSTITMDVPENSLGVARGQQRNIEGWTERRDPRFVKNEEK
jgi:bifunctional UDP-N-acetylglucosamine pyrophosphorylase / glucosamine-1-phosphate N-acetyltransferase